MRSMIAKLAILLALPIALLTGCSGSLTGEIKSALKAEKAEAAKAQVLGSVYIKSCIESLTIAVPEADIANNLMSKIQALQYCLGRAQATVDKLTSVNQAAAKGCVQTLLSNLGPPTNSEQEASLLATCETAARKATGQEEKKAEGATGASGASESSPEAEASPSAE